MIEAKTCMCMYVGGKFNEKIISYVNINDCPVIRPARN